MSFTNDKQIELLKDNGLIENSGSLPENSNPAVPASDRKHHLNKLGLKRKYDEKLPELWVYLDGF